jgi:uncharacterized protein DUF5647
MSDYYKQLNVDLGAEFDLLALEQPEWMSANVPAGAIVVLQTDDPAFNRWARETAEHSRLLEKPPRPLVLVHVRELRPAKSHIVRAEAEVLAN